MEVSAPYLRIGDTEADKDVLECSRAHVLMDSVKSVDVLGFAFRPGPLNTTGKRKSGGGKIVTMKLRCKFFISRY